MEHVTDPIDSRLLDDWQRDFPVTHRPFQELADELDTTEADVIARLDRMKSTGRVSRVGATIAPNTISASTLAAVSVLPERIDEVAAIIGAEPGVNHNYLRENDWNMWFVATGHDREAVDATLARIEANTGLRVLDLRLMRPFNVDLGFKMSGAGGKPPAPRSVDISALQAGDRKILQALSRGMEIAETPYASLAAKLGMDEAYLCDRITKLQTAGIASRLGVIVRHRALGWSANAMVVWDLPENDVPAAGAALAALPGVTLAYERRPEPGIWPYRLYCMVHARCRSEAHEVISRAIAMPEMANAKHNILFSTRCFKQTGALIAAPREVAA